MPVSAVGGAVHADLFTGTATTSIPIAVPPGRGGVQPNLALVYNSANGNGWVGLGWKLEKSVIERQTKFGLNYSGDAYTFRLAGINVDLVNIGTSQYRAKIEGGFTRVQKLTASDGKPYFLATDKTGQKFYFGRTAATRVANPSDATKIFRWCLDRVEDLDGNYMTISYTGDQGQGYLARIDYTGHGSTRPTNSVIFHLETRPDAVPMYTSHFLMKTAKRLKTIEVRANNRLVRAYKLTYTSSAGTSRSLLRSVTQYGKDATIRSGSITGGSSLPAVSMTYTSTGTRFVSSGFSRAFSNVGGWNRPEYYSTIAYPDLNGDGKPDICARGIGGVGCWLNTGTRFVSSGFSRAFSNAGGWNRPEYYSTIAYPDLNGDGKADICARGIGGVGCWLNTGTRFVTSGFSRAFSNAGGWNLPEYYSTIAYPDLNGDGKADICARGIGGMGCWLNTGTRFVSSGFSRAFSNAGGWNRPEYYSTIAYPDLNGDGKADICARGIGGVGCWLNTGTRFVTSGFSRAFSNAGGWNLPEYYSTIAYPDLNGDGKADICARGIGGMGCWLNTGTRFVSSGFSRAFSNAGGWNRPEYYSTIAYPDLNGDGKADICARGIGGVGCWLNTGTRFVTSGFSRAFSNAGGWNLPEYYSTIAYPDLNGDGKADICARGIGGVGCWLVNANSGNTLTTLTNGLGATTTITYKPSTQYANTQLPYPTQTVASIATNDGNGTTATTTYTYAGGYHHIGDREFRGFHYAKVTGPAGPSGEKTITETWFHQGNDLAVGSNNPAVANGYLKGAPYRTKVTDARGNRYSETTTTYTADANGRAPFFTPPASVVIKTCDGNATCRTTRTDYTYDAYGNVTQERQYGDTATTTDDRTVLRTYAANTTKWIVTLPTRETIRAGLGTTGTQLARTDFYYDGTTSCAAASTNQTPTKGHLTRSVRWLSGATTHPETRMAYNSQGNLICTRDANGHTTTTAYDSTGTFVTTVTNAQGHVTTTAYYGVNGVATTRGVYGQVQSVTDANGAVVTTEYDALGRRTKVTQPDGFWTTTSYVSFGTVGSQHVRTDSQLGLSTWTYFDGLGRTTKQQSTGAESSQIITETQYDARGAVTRTSVPYKAGTSTKQWSTSTYDPLGRVVQTTHPDGTRTRACYDDGVTVTLDAKNHKKRTTRDAYGRVTKVEEYTGTFSTCTTARGTPYATTTYAHDRLGNLTTVTDTLGNRTTMTYDTLSRKTSMRDPDLGTWTYAYDRNGNLTRQTDAKGQQTHFRYDALNRRTQKDYGTQKTAGASTADVRYNYDGSRHPHHHQGRLQQVADASGTTRFYYDVAGRVTQTDKIVDGTTYTTRSTYDGLGRVTGMTYPAGRTTGTATRKGQPIPFGNERFPSSLASHNGKIYMVGSSNDALYTVNPTTGRATRVGTATNFGVDETSPMGLASHNGKLYMVGLSNDALYTVNPTTGAATRVGSARRFGVGEDSPVGLGSHNGKLYMVGRHYAALYTLNPTTGVAARVGSATNFGVREYHPGGLASHNGTLYMVGRDYGVLYTLNPTTGAAARVGSARRFGVNEGSPSGLASHNGTLYMVGWGNDSLYTVNTTTGVAARVGTPYFGVNERLPNGVVSHNGTLYMVGRNNDALYTLNPTTGVAARVGTATKFGVNEGSPSGVASHKGTLYMVGQSNDALYTVNTTTGRATRVGRATRFGVNEYDPMGVASHNGKLYMVGGWNDALYTLNTTTGRATRVGTAARFGVNEGSPHGLTSHKSTLYMTGGDAMLYAVNPTTGVATPAGRNGTFGVSSWQLRGLASHNGTLYLLDEDTYGLYTVSPPSTVTYTYTGPQLQSVQEGSTTYARYSGFNALGQPSTLTLGNGTTTRYTYDSRNYRLKTLRTVKSSTVLQNLGYTFDTAGNVTSLTDPRHGTQTFAYDDLNRLTQATGGYGTHTYAYNQIGNRLSHSVPSSRPTGTATRVGSATNFGVNEVWPTGVTSHKGKLYMVGEWTDALYTLNPTTGRATRVGSATRFGVNEKVPNGLTSHNGKLYMLGGSTSALYTLNPTTGVATRVGTARGFGVREWGPQGLASHNGKLYMVGERTDALYTLNPTTGVATRVGTATQFGVREWVPQGLASHNGKLYMVGERTDALYTVNPTTGVATRVGTATNFGVGESQPRDLASHNGTLYMTGDSTNALYRLPSTTTTAYTYNPSGTTSTRPHAVTRAGTNTYSYDANGNMLMGDGRVMTYDYENRLSTVRKNGAATSFVYDGDGGRVKKTVTNGGTTTTTTYVGKLYVCEGTSCSRLIYAGSQRIALVPEPPSGRTASPSYFHPDHLGSTSVLTNAQGVAEEHNSYRPYGQLHTHTGTSDVAYKYTGQERDPSTGLYFYNARYYDPALGRFISPDTIVESPLHPQTLNRYAYAGNNPVLYNDPTGHCFIVCAVIFGALVGTVAAGIASDWDPGATLLGAAIGGISAGVGAKVGGYVAATVGAKFGSTLGAGAGLVAGGAAAGGTSSVLYRAAGYNVNIGLSIGAGAAGALVGGGVGVKLGLLAGAAAGGAVSSTIMGGDPGEGALYAMAAAVVSLGVQYANYKYQEYQASKDQINTGELRIASSQENPLGGGGHCVESPTGCNGISGRAYHQTKTRLRLEITNRGENPTSVTIKMGHYLPGKYGNVDTFIHNNAPFFDIRSNPILPGATYGIDFGQYPSFGGYFLIDTGNGHYQVPGFVPYKLNRIPVG